MSSEETDPVRLLHRHLEQIAMAALGAGRTLMETGSRADVVQQGASMVARGFGADQVHVRVGYASLAITVSSGSNSITRMTGVGAHGVNLRLNHALRQLCAEVSLGGMTVAEAAAAFTALVRNTPRASWLVVALAVGLACASFGRLLGIDLAAFLPVLAAGALGQGLRHHLLKAKLNAFVVAAVVAFVAASVAGLSGRLFGSATLPLAMSAAVLLLVPGVPVLNAQTDIMEGHPTLGSARAVSVLMILIFVTVGVGLAQSLLNIPFSSVVVPHRPFLYQLLHQMAFGAVAAGGFGVLFNANWSCVFWASLTGALALAVRTLGLDAGWSLAAASFAAAAAVGVAVQLLDRLPAHISYAGNALAVAGCIPMVPGSAAAQAIMGLLSLTAQHPEAPTETLVMTAEYGLRVIFTIGAIGTGLTMATHLLPRPDFTPKKPPPRQT